MENNRSYAYFCAKTFLRSKTRKTRNSAETALEWTPLEVGTGFSVAGVPRWFTRHLKKNPEAFERGFRRQGGSYFPSIHSISIVLLLKIWRLDSVSSGSGKFLILLFIC